MGFGERVCREFKGELKRSWPLLLLVLGPPNRNVALSRFSRLLNLPEMCCGRMRYSTTTSLPPELEAAQEVEDSIRSERSHAQALAWNTQ